MDQKKKTYVMAYQWLPYIANENNIYIPYGRNKGGKIFGPYKVDGYFGNKGQRQVLEFHGCFWHGCSKCFSQSSINPVNDMSMSDLYARTMEKRQFIESECYYYTPTWECEWRKLLKSNESMKKYIDSLEM